MLLRSLFVLLGRRRLNMRVLGRSRVPRSGWQRALLCSQGSKFCAVWRKQSFGEQVAIYRWIHTIESRLTQVAIANNAGDSGQACPQRFALLQRAIAVG